MSKAVDIIDGVLFVNTRHYDDVNRVIICNQKKPYRVFSDDEKKEWNRPRGEWQKWSIDERFNLLTYKCSECGFIVAKASHDASMNYCGNCGADMRKEGEAE